MSSITSLRRKDHMWIYKNPQGLQLLNDELEQRRKKRFTRNKSNKLPEEVILPPLSPKQKHSCITDEPLQALIPIATKIIIVANKSTPKEHKSIEEPQLRSPVNPKSADKKIIASNIKENPLLQQDQMIKKENKQCILEREHKLKPVRIPAMNSTLQEKKEALKKCAKQDQPSPLARAPLPKRVSPPSVQVLSPHVRFSSPPLGVTSTTQVASPSVRVASPPVRVASPPVRVASPPVRVASPPVRVASPPVRVASPPVRVASPPVRVASPPVETSSSTVEASSPPVRVSTYVRVAPTKPENNFLLEAKQKLFSNQQQNTNIFKKSLPNTPSKKNSFVSSFISTFETPSANKSGIDLPPKPPRHVIMPLTPASSISTPLCAVAENIVPVSSSSSVIPIKDSYFSAVLDRRFSATPTEELNEEEPIQQYLPQLSPEISFCGSTLDIPSDDEYISQERPCIKKRVSFSEQISTYIPEDDASVSTVEEARSNSPITSFVRTLSSELTEVSTQYGADNHPREKFLPPQKLSNKLLDMFQKKPKVIDQPTTRELTHLTKSRPRKPASLKKPTTLTYPAAIAQPDWRTRAILTKKSSVFI